MSEQLPEFWQEKLPDLEQQLKPGLETGEWVANTSAAALGLAIALGVTNPVAGIAAASLAFAGPIKKVIEVYADKKQGQSLTLEEVVAIAAPLAYLRSFETWVQSNDRLREIQKPQTSQPLKQVTLDQGLAINALRCFHRSELAQAFNQILVAQLQQAGLSQREAQLITSWVAWQTDHYLKKAPPFEELGITGIYQAGGDIDSSPYQSIKTYLKDQIATKPKETVFNETFTFEQIYVRLKASPVDANGKVNQYASPFILEDWAKGMLRDSHKSKQVIFIQGGPGRGKTVFCRMFADWVRQHFHPLWTPILIRLRDIDAFEQSFEKTLQGAVKANFARDESWLTDCNQRFLFLLDGFDELRMEGRISGGVERFIQQVGAFQERCQTSEMGHRFIVTGRQLALQGISYLPNNLERVELQSMDDNLQQQWLEKWRQVVAQDVTVAAQKTAAFKEFLQAESFPEQVREELAREPLLLYLLAAMHRDGDIEVKDLEGTGGIQAKIRIYEKALEWVLTEQRQHIQREIVRLDAEELRQILIEAGLCVVQSGGEYARIKMIEERIEKDITLKIQEIRNKGDDALKNALSAFYLKPAAGDEGGSVEFFHKSFGEFLCAKRIQCSLEEWTERRTRNRFYLDESKLAEEIYDLLGYGVLTPELVEYLFGLLLESEEFRPVELFSRLEDFYLRWCEGEFIDAEGTTLPQAKMRKLQQQKPKKDEKGKLGQRQVDLYTGLNVMILLLELHRHGQQREDLKAAITFYPCGKPNEQGKLEDPTRLLRLIGYSDCLGTNGFRNSVGDFLIGAYLIGAYLSGANLIGTNLSRANLSGANLSRANLSDTNLSGANLIGANLIWADLSGANLILADLSDANLIWADLSDTNLSGANLSGDFSGANLSGAYLIGANLSDTNLSGANLIGADLSGADLSDDLFGDVRWNKETRWENVSGLETAINVPEALKRQLFGEG